MMIMRFHKLIQSRLLWLIFLGIVVVSFVFWGAMEGAGDQGVTRQLRAPVAHLNGRAISFLEFDVTRRLVERNMGRDLPADQVSDFVFERFAMVDFARSIGLRVPETLAQQEFFRSLADEEGQVDPMFLEMVRQNLRSEGITEEQVVRFIRDEMLIQELQRILTAFVHVPRFDAERWASLQTDVFEVALLHLVPEMLPEPVELSDEEIAAHFAAHAEDFQIPELRSVRFLKLDVAGFISEEDALSEAQARQVYDQNPQRFRRMVPRMDDEGNFSFDTEQISFEDALEDIRTNYKMTQARERAEEEALGISVRLTPRRGRTPPTMEALAEELGMTVMTAGPFRVGETLPEVPNSAALVQAAFELDDSLQGRTSRPLVSRDTVLVAQLTEVIAPRDPELEEVLDAVTEAAFLAATETALQALGASLLTQLQAAIAEGASLEEAAAALEVELDVLPPFQLSELNMAMPFVPATLAEAVTGHAAGDVFGPLEDLRRGGWFLAGVIERTSQPAERDEMLFQMENFLAGDFHMQGLMERLRDVKLMVNFRRVNDES